MYYVNVSILLLPICNVYISVYIYIYICIYIYTYVYIYIHMNINSLYKPLSLYIYNVYTYLYLYSISWYHPHGFSESPRFQKALLRGCAEYCEGVQFLEGHVTHARSLEAKHSFRYGLRGWAGMARGSENHGKTMGKPWENWKTEGKWWFSMEFDGDDYHLVMMFTVCELENGHWNSQFSQL